MYNSFLLCIFYRSAIIEGIHIHFHSIMVHLHTLHVKDLPKITNSSKLKKNFITNTKYYGFSIKTWNNFWNTSNFIRVCTIITTNFKFLKPFLLTTFSSLFFPLSLFTYSLLNFPPYLSFPLPVTPIKLLFIKEKKKKRVLAFA